MKTGSRQLVLRGHANDPGAIHLPDRGFPVHTGGINKHWDIGQHPRQTDFSPSRGWHA
ncbi:MAG: hypothetical protein R3C12_07555 [Planctomycetaceae bacterium]